MTKAEWGAIYNFKPEEFDSKDKPGSGLDGMQYDFMRSLDKARTRAGVPFNINSGFRTAKRNKEVGGRKNSSHLRGWAADIDLVAAAKKLKTTVPALRDAILDALEFEGFTRFGLYRTFIHVDADPSLPKNRIWVEGE